MNDPAVALVVAVAVLMAAAFAAGVMNSVAGGGTLLTFPALIAFLEQTYISRLEARVGVKQRKQPSDT